MDIQTRYLPIPAPNGLLAGARDGRRFAARLAECAGSAHEPTVAIVDLRGSRMATGSWLREAIFRPAGEERDINSALHIAAANCSAELLEEIKVVADFSGQCLTTLEWTNGAPRGVRLTGPLSDSLTRTMQITCLRDWVSGTDLAEDPGLLTPSAWNNRLAALNLKGLLVSVRPHRSRYYRTLFDGVYYGM